MKLFVFVKSIVLVSLFSLNVFAAGTSSKIPYYGEQFYNDLKTGVSNQDLLTSVKTVLRSFHVKNNNDTDKIVASCSGASNCYSHVAVGYGRARVFLMGKFYLVQTGGQYGVRDVYCQKVYTDGKPGPNIIPSDKVVNIEHTWPQSRFNGRFDKETQKSDMHHLFPTDSQINSARGNMEFGEVVHDSQELKCAGPRLGTAGTGGGDVFEPPQPHKGHVARALFYFAARYDMKFSKAEEATLRKWHRDEPVDQEEIARNEEIYKLQGNRNPFIDFPELVDKISNF